MPLAHSIAGQHIARWPHKKDDILSAAYLGLSKAINRIAAGALKDDNSNSYIAVYIYYEIKTFLMEDRLIRVPLSSFDTRIEDASLIEDPGTLPSKEYQGLDWDDYHLTEEEARVINLRLRRYTLKEIGEAIGKSYVMVHKIIGKIRGKISGK